jgi:predicted ATPase
MMWTLGGLVNRERRWARRCSTPEATRANLGATGLIDSSSEAALATSFISAVSIRNYKSIDLSRVRLGNLTLLVGPNGAGKSNFLDALRFVADALNTTLENALRDRGGVDAVRRRSRTRPRHFGIRLDLNLEGRPASYAFRIGAEKDGGFVVQREECRLSEVVQRPLADDRPGESGHHYMVKEGVVVSASPEVRTALERDRLALVALSGLPEFRPVYDGLRRMGFYNLNPQRMRELQDPDPGHLLARDGRNLAAIVRELGRFQGGAVLRLVEEHLQAVVPGITGIEHKAVGPKETVEFLQVVAGDPNAWRFPAENMSDGTLRALGILAAAFQAQMNGQRRVTLVGIEEPEEALHPGATEVIAVALLNASRGVQVIVTTHSPDLLDHKEIRDEHLRAVSADKGATVVSMIDEISRAAIRDKLYLPGELLARGTLHPDEALAEREAAQLALFSDGDE